MKISNKAWMSFIRKLGSMNTKASGMIVDYMAEHEILSEEGRSALLDYAFAVATKYGEGAATLSCEMYDEIARVQNVSVPPAVPAPTPTYGEVAKTVNGAALFSKNPDYIGGAVGKLVKRTGVDTTLNNALRDGAEWAWIPHGDTCPFCLVLASNGWQRASKKALKNGHANHIHANCDCTYAIRFDGVSTVEGYDPEALYEQYMDAEGRTSGEKVKFLRRQNYAANKEVINEQTRKTYAKRKLAELNKNGDPIFDIYGPISESHPEEMRRIRKSATEKGVEIKDGSERMAYSPGLKRGQPGQLIISENDSIGAWLHEEQHMLDDEKDGFPGFEGMFDIDRRCTMEYNAYKREIEIARDAGRDDIVKRLKMLCKNEIKAIGGVWDAKKLE